MAIEVELQDEHGVTLATYDGPALTFELLRLIPQSAALLRTIDPWGDTVFNQIQIGALLAEIDTHLHTTGGRTPPAAFKALRQFVESALGITHTYVKFIGD